MLSTENKGVDKFSKSLQEKRILLLRLNLWIQSINNFSKDLQKETDYFPKLFQVAYFLSVIKKQYSEVHISDLSLASFISVLKRQHNESQIDGLSHTAKDLKQEEKKLKEQITQLEYFLWKNLKIPVTVSLGLKFLTMSYYYQMSNAYFNSLDQAPPTSMVHMTFSPNYRQALKLIGSGLLLGLDRYWLGNAAIAYTFLNTINDLLLIERQEGKCNDIIRWNLGLTSYLLVLSDYGNLGYAFMHYFVMTSISKLIGTAINKLSKYFHLKNYSFMASLAGATIQHISTLLLTHWITPRIYAYLSDFWKPIDLKRLLTDKDYCLKYPTACERCSRDKLKISKDSVLTRKEVHDQWLKLMKIDHPDKPSGDNERASFLNGARDRLYDLFAS